MGLPVPALRRPRLRYQEAGLIELLTIGFVPVLAGSTGGAMVGIRYGSVPAGLFVGAIIYLIALALTGDQL